MQPFLEYVAALPPTDDAVGEWALRLQVDPRVKDFRSFKSYLAYVKKAAGKDLTLIPPAVRIWFDWRGKQIDAKSMQLD